MEQVIKIFIQIIKTELNRETLEDDVIKQITPDIIKQLYRISCLHDLVHIVAVSLQKYQLLNGQDDISQKFLNSIYMAVKRYENFRHEQEEIFKLFEKEQIVYIPLKGAVIRNYYVEPWFRTSSDIDILIHPEDIERACELLVSRLHYTQGAHHYKDVSLFAPSGVHLELHFMILEHNKKLDHVLERVWKYVYPVSEGSFRYQMTPEFFMFHVYVHMSYHFTEGGCGVRMLMDTWLLENQMQFDENVLKQLCQECGIWKFVQVSRRLNSVWFEGKEHDELTLKTQNYVIQGGAGGTDETIMLAHKTRVKGRARYVLSRLFMPYVDLCILYPPLKRIPVLYPYYTVVRWFSVFSGKVFMRVANEYKINGKVKTEEVEELKGLFRELGL